MTALEERIWHEAILSSEQRRYQLGLPVSQWLKERAAESRIVMRGRARQAIPRYRRMTIAERKRRARGWVNGLLGGDE